MIKTFALSKFIYLASVIHIPDYIIQQIDKVIFNFLWNGGNGFIKKCTIIGDIDKGGLKMVDVKSMFIAQKIKWVNKYNTTSATWKIIFNEFILPYGGDLVFYCNIHPKEIQSWKRVPVFYKDMLKSYFTFIYSDNADPYHQCIWNNQYICINQKPCYYKYFHNCGLILVSDLFYTNGQIIPFDVWCQRGIPRKYYLQWRSIIDAIPASWKQVLKHGFERDICTAKGFILIHDDNEIHIGDMTSKFIYYMLIQKILKPPTSQKRHKDEFNIQDNEWSEIYLMPFKSSYDVRTRIFQYKINLNCLMTNTRLYKMNIIDNEYCTHCNNFLETTRHLFWDCIHAVKIWNDFKSWYETNCNKNVDLDYKKIIFGTGTNDSDRLFNLCLILVKKVIFDNRFKNQIPSIVSFKQLIKFHYKLEKQIAMNNNNLCAFMNKWHTLETFCTDET